MYCLHFEAYACSTCQYVDCALLLCIIDTRDCYICLSILLLNAQVFKVLLTYLLLFGRGACSPCPLMKTISCACGKTCFEVEFGRLSVLLFVSL